ncbi:MAG: circularly permuted type 2 ATP-grasp protein, partial [Thermoleophilia bacterium]
YEDILETLAEMDLSELCDELLEDSREHGVWFAGADGPRPFRLDPVPRLINPAEWVELERGLGQRVEALDRFVADVYGEQEIVAAGSVPARVVESCDHFERRLVGLPAAPARVVVAGLDIVRDTDGRFLVLEDNVRTPSGIGYALAAREALDRHLPDRLAEARVSLDPTVEMLAAALRESAPAGVDDPSVVLISDGRDNSAWYEHERIARALAIPLVTPADLEVAGGRLTARVDGHRLTLDVVYRRTDEDRLTDERGELTAVGAALFEPLRAGRLACVNAFGTGVADDKLITGYVEDMVRFYLGVEPALRTVRTYDPQVPEQRATVLERIGELVIKPRAGFGGQGVVVAPHARPE